MKAESGAHAGADSAIGLVRDGGAKDALRLRAYCQTRSWNLRLRALPPSPAGAPAALGQILATARRTGARWLVATPETLALVESDHHGSWRALVDLLDRLNVGVMAV